jgi:hypothetical protein
MVNEIWTFLRDPANQAVLTWIGGGIVIIVGAVWAVLKFFLSRSAAVSPRSNSVSADHGSISIGRTNKNSPLTATRRTQRD